MKDKTMKEKSNKDKITKEEHNKQKEEKKFGKNLYVTYSELDTDKINN